MNNPLVTVAMITYNQSKYVRQALESLRCQNLPADQYEVIVVNDGSTDQTRKVMKDAIKKYSANGSELRFVNHLYNKGLVTRCNEVLEVARGQYFTRLDSDDLAMPSLLSSLLKNMNYDRVCYSDYFLLEKGELKVKFFEKNNLYDIQACGIMYPTSILRDVGGYRDFFWEEYDLHLRLMQKHFEFFHYREPLWAYRKHSEGMTENLHKRLRGWADLIDCWGSDLLLTCGPNSDLEFVADLKEKKWRQKS